MVDMNYVLEEENQEELVQAISLIKNEYVVCLLVIRVIMPH